MVGTYRLVLQALEEIDHSINRFNFFLFTAMSKTSEESQRRTYRYVAGCEWISGITGETTAGWLMIIDLALSINSARPHARILALVIDASFRVSAVRILNALRSAALIRITSIIGQASTRSRAITLFTYGVRTAR